MPDANVVSAEMVRAVAEMEHFVEARLALLEGEEAADAVDILRDRLLCMTARWRPAERRGEE